MNFLDVVPTRADVTVHTGMDDDVHAYQTDHGDAVKQANRWNNGELHPDVWMDITYDCPFNGTVSCDCLFDNDMNMVVGFVQQTSSNPDNP